MPLMNPKQLKLPNGLNLILYPMSSVQSVSVYVTVGAGPRYETEETSGLAHFLEHMLFEGTKKFPTSKEISSRIEKLGGSASAYTDKEYVMYYLKIPKKYLETGLDYLSDILFNSLLNQKAIIKEKRILSEEMKRAIDNADWEIWNAWYEWVWGKDQWLGRPTLGEEGTIQNITKKKLQDYIGKLYHPSNMVIAVAGNFSIERAEELIKQYFGKQQSKKSPFFEKLKFIPKNIRTKIIKVNTNQVHLILGFVTGISNEHIDRFPIRVITDILTIGASSRLFNKLVYELGIAYSTGSQAWPLNETGLFYIYGDFSAKNIKKAIKVILEEIKNLKKEKVSDEELNEAKERDKNGLYFSLETPDSIASLFSVQRITEKRIITPEEIIKGIDKVTSGDIQRAARKYLTKENLRLVIRGPFEENNLESIEKLLK